MSKVASVRPTDFLIWCKKKCGRESTAQLNLTDLLNCMRLYEEKFGGKKKGGEKVKSTFTWKGKVLKVRKEVKGNGKG